MPSRWVRSVLHRRCHQPRCAPFGHFPARRLPRAHSLPPTLATTPAPPSSQGLHVHADDTAALPLVQEGGLGAVGAMADSVCPRYGLGRPETQKVRYDASELSWFSAREFCQRKGAQLCCAADVCSQERGKPFFGVRSPPPPRSPNPRASLARERAS